jgi:hypothetical protein
MSLSAKDTPQDNQVNPIDSPSPFNAPGWWEPLTAEDLAASNSASTSDPDTRLKKLIDKFQRWWQSR